MPVLQRCAKHGRCVPAHLHLAARFHPAALQAYIRKTMLPEDGGVQQQQGGVQECGAR